MRASSTRPCSAGCGAGGARSAALRSAQARQRIAHAAHWRCSAATGCIDADQALQLEVRTRERLPGALLGSESTSRGRAARAETAPPSWATASTFRRCARAAASSMPALNPHDAALHAGVLLAGDEKATDSAAAASLRTCLRHEAQEAGLRAGASTPSAALTRAGRAATRWCTAHAAGQSTQPVIEPASSKNDGPATNQRRLEAVSERLRYVWSRRDGLRPSCCARWVCALRCAVHGPDHPRRCAEDGAAELQAPRRADGRKRAPQGGDQPASASAVRVARQRAELGGTLEAPRTPSKRSCCKCSTRLVPGAGRMSRCSRQKGARPMLPDGPPVIGASAEGLCSTSVILEWLGAGCGSACARANDGGREAPIPSKAWG